MKMTFDLSPDEFNQIFGPNDQLTRMETFLHAILELGEKQMIDVQALVTAVAQETTVDNSIVELLNQVVAQNKQLSVDLAAAIAANDPVAMAAVQKQVDDSTASLQANIAKITDAVTANTPQA